MKYEYIHPKELRVHGVLTYNEKKEEGQVRMHSNIPRDVVGLDTLSDWIVDLQSEYDALSNELFKESKHD
jgi:hypothetical protein